MKSTLDSQFIQSIEVKSEVHWSRSEIENSIQMTKLMKRWQ